MKIDTSLWNNNGRLGERVKNVSTMVMSLAAINTYEAIAHKSWIILGINILFLLSVIPVFISYSKWKKEPPQEGIK